MCENRSKEQKLIDLCFEMVLSTTSVELFCQGTNEEKAKWVADSLRICGFDTVPCGMSWGVLKNE